MPDLKYNIEQSITACLHHVIISFRTLWNHEKFGKKYQTVELTPSVLRVVSLPRPMPHSHNQQRQHPALIIKNREMTPAEYCGVWNVYCIPTSNYIPWTWSYHRYKCTWFTRYSKTNDICKFILPDLYWLKLEISWTVQTSLLQWD